MAYQRPLVLVNGQIEQLQAGDVLDAQAVIVGPQGADRADRSQWAGRRCNGADRSDRRDGCPGNDGDHRSNRR